MGINFDFDFYQTADNFSVSEPGDLLKFEPIKPSTLDVADGTTVYRFQYTSKDLDGSNVPSTGFIALPFTVPTDTGKYPLVAFAHGTIGLFTGCAPSTSPALFDYNSWSPLVARGYAVVATDYAGLGNNYTEHKYISFTAHANDLSYSVQAARKAFPTLFTDKWMSVGHSQGGGAVWKLSESQQPCSGYIGTVSAAPASKIFDMALLFPEIASSPDIHKKVITGETASIALAVQRVFPNYTFPWLGEGLRKRVELAKITQSCISSFLGFSLDLPADQIWKPNVNPATDDLLKQFQLRNAPAQGDLASQPMLVVQGLKDTSILPRTTIEAFQSISHSKLGKVAPVPTP